MPRQFTPEQIRFHAAGHLAAADLIAELHPEAAQRILEVVIAYASSVNVSSPPALLQKLGQALINPSQARQDLRLLEEWFCSPLNAMIENSGSAGGFSG